MPTISQSNWNVNYYWSQGSGLQLGICDYNGTRVLWNASVPFAYVDYLGNSSGPFTDELQSTSGQMTVRQIMRGFDLKVSYDIYGADYQYDHVWRFHDDGRFGSTIIIQGPGEEIDGHHTYHLPFRFDLDISGAGGDSIQRWLQLLGTGFWVDVPQEGQLLPSSPQGSHYDWQVIDKATSRRAMIRAGELGTAELWTLAYSGSEAWGAWGGAQPAAPGSPGSVPAIYDNHQSVQNTDVVLWYIAHVSSRDLVATCGPWLKLQGF